MLANFNLTVGKLKLITKHRSIDNYKNLSNNGLNWELSKSRLAFSVSWEEMFKFEKYEMVKVCPVPSNILTKWYD